jgi:hypothetical protein
MSKKDDLKLVFDFIADYLREEEKKIENKTTQIPQSRLLMSESKPMLSDSISETKNAEFDAAHIKDIMDRVERKATEAANTTSMLKAQKNDFKEEIKKIKSGFVDELIEQKTNDENLPVSATTNNVIYKAEGDGLGLIKNFIESETKEVEPQTPKIKKKGVNK